MIEREKHCSILTNTLGNGWIKDILVGLQMTFISNCDLNSEIQQLDQLEVAA